eukprot:CAMPEP_0179922192 /NCGR_PEP_ID=MMETSP0983-20121128/5502_1 /TAXON_ID=483367 /ORGANISM="non described non described, Strain CCMP 2436" /LENGTH=30 /DNA_ID= /DNA_START= /DNA_END= /DNA_ORIENTATION=
MLARWQARDVCSKYVVDAVDGHLRLQSSTE